MRQRNSAKNPSVFYQAKNRTEISPWVLFAGGQAIKPRPAHPHYLTAVLGFFHQRNEMPKHWQRAIFMVLLFYLKTKGKAWLIQEPEVKVGSGFFRNTISQVCQSEEIEPIKMPFPLSEGIKESSFGTERCQEASRVVSIGAERQELKTENTA